MHPTNCLNCGTFLTADDHFCPNCGQKSNTHRITLSHILHEFFHSFTHADKGFLGMVADLAVKPAVVATEYIAGKRKKYFNPFTFFILCVGILVFVTNVFHTIGEPLKINENVIRQLPTEKAKQQYVTLINRTNTAQTFIKKYLNTISMFLLPFYAFVYWIFFRRRGYNYSELMVGYMLFSSFSSLALALLVFPWLGRAEKSPFFIYLVGAGLLLQILYIGIAEYRFLRFKNPFAILLTTFATLLCTVFVFVCMFIGQYYYIFRSAWWKVLKLTWQNLFK